MSDREDTGDSVEDTAPWETLSAGEVGEADDAARDAGLADVIVGEIPDPHHLTHLLWTARCTVPAHGLLGTFETQEMAEVAKRQHLLVGHGEGQLQ
jgi:hypothetical protein